MLLGFMADAGEHTVIWAEGVSAAGGWYDVDKSGDGTDDMLCYAASAANLVAWWQQRSHLDSSAPDDITSIWNTYRSACLNTKSGGDPLAAMNWWISGIYAPTHAAEVERSLFNMVSPGSEIITLSSFGGYYYDQYGLGRAQLEDLFSYRSNTDADPDNNYDNAYFGELLSSGAGVSLSIRSDSGNLAHAITLWGVEYESGVLSKIWVTDSDDATLEADYKECFSIDVVTNQETGTVYFDMSLESDVGSYEWQKWMGEQIYILGVSAIHPAATAGWQLLIPEPSTATLSLLALVALVSRRRR